MFSLIDDDEAPRLPDDATFRLLDRDDNNDDDDDEDKDDVDDDEDNNTGEA